MDINNPVVIDHVVGMSGKIVRPRVATLAGATGVTPRANVLIWKDDSVDEYYMPRGLLGLSDVLLVPKVLEIGAWNMDTTMQVNIPHGLALADIRFVQVSIMKDGETTLKIHAWGGAGFAFALNVSCDATNVDLTRDNGGPYDHVDYNDPGINRGFIVVWSVP